MTKTKSLTLAAFLIALDVIFTRFFSFYTPGNLDRLSLQFLACAIAGFLFSPLTAGFIGVSGDIVGMLVNSGGFSFTPGFTLSAFVRCFIFSIILHKKEITYKRSLIASILVTIVVDLILNPIWLHFLYGKAYVTILFAKIPVRFIWLFVMSFVIYKVLSALKPFFKKIT